MSKESYDHDGPEPKRMVCICPYCGEWHEKVMSWIGRGTPHVYCGACKSKVGRISADPERMTPKAEMLL